MKKYFANIFMVAVMLLAGVAMTACSSSPDSISERTILKQVNELMESKAENVTYAPLMVGKFECNDEGNRLFYRQMEAAGLVEYSVERFAWWERATKPVRERYKVLRHSWWDTYYDTEYRWVRKTVYDFCDHYIVQVWPTKKGNKLCIEALPEPVVEKDKDMKQPEEDTSKYAWNKADLSEEWPFIPNPFLEPEKPVEPEVEEVVAEEIKTYEPSVEPVAVAEAVAAMEPEGDGVDRIDINQYNAYCNRADDSTQDLWIKVCELEAVKARNIQIFERDGARYARAEVIISTVDVTDAGRIIAGKQEDERELRVFEFVYFQDKGWVLAKNE